MSNYIILLQEYSRHISSKLTYVKKRGRDLWLYCLVALSHISKFVAETLSPTREYHKMKGSCIET